MTIVLIRLNDCITAIAKYDFSFISQFALELNINNRSQHVKVFMKIIFKSCSNDSNVASFDTAWFLLGNMSRLFETVFYLKKG